MKISLLRCSKALKGFPARRGTFPPKTPPRSRWPRSRTTSGRRSSHSGGCSSLRKAVAGKAKKRASARLGNSRLQPPLRGQRAESVDRPRLLGGRWLGSLQCAAIDVSNADIRQCVGQPPAPLQTGGRRQGYEAPGGFADRRCGVKCRARRRFPWTNNCRRRASGNRAGLQTIGLLDLPTHPCESRLSVRQANGRRRTCLSKRSSRPP